MVEQQSFHKPNVGSTLGEYQLTSRLGDGGMGIVYKVLYLPTGKAYALKWFRPGQADSFEIRNVFVRCSVLNHTGVVRFRDQATGRRAQDSKLELVAGHVDVSKHGVLRSRCVERRVQSGWRLIDGQARYICYHLYALPENDHLPEVAGLRSCRSEYGLEIILTVAFLHYWSRLSLDHVCGVIDFFTGLALSKSQANALLNQLSADWDDQYDTIAELLRQMVIYIDETGWKSGSDSCYTWAFLTAMHVLFCYGVGRGKTGAEAILGEQFQGIGVTDDYGAYQSLFLKHQLCWVHLLRKAIKLMLQQPTSYF